MAITHRRSKRKPSGARYKKKGRSKKLHQRGSLPTHPVIDKRKSKKVRTKGGSAKQRLMRTDTANVLDPKTKKYSKAKIQNVVENTANRNYVRRNILTKGTVIKTDKGNAKITSRPAQDGTVNAVLV